jgi:hypothetical protein
MRQHFLDMEWLGDIVIGPSVDSGDLVGPPVTRRQDENWCLYAVCTPALQDADTVQLRQAQIQDDAVIGFGFAQEMRFFAIIGAVSDITGLLKRRFQLTVQIAIIFHNQDTHDRSLPVRPPCLAALIARQ